MISRRTVSLLLGSIGILAVSPQVMAQRGSPRMEFGGRSIDAMIADFMSENGIPGMALAIVQAPYIPRVTGYGLADTDKQLLVGSNTLFDVAQMADAFTAVAIMQLVEAGKFRLDDPIGRHLHDLPGAWRTVTLRNLLQHASGIPDYTHVSTYDPTHSYSLASLTALIGSKPLAFQPGHDIADSATDYALLVQLVSAASGQRYSDFIRRNQFERLGLSHTLFADQLEHVKREKVELNSNRHKHFLAEAALINPTEPATGYRSSNDRLIPASAVLPNGSILASAMDVSIWDIGLAGGILVNDPGLRAILYQPGKLADGRSVPVMGGWRFPGRKGLMYITGNGHGYSAFLSRFTDPSELVCVTLLANREGVDLTQLARQIAGAYDKQLGPPTVEGTRMQQSPYSVPQTLERFEAVLRAENITIAPHGDDATEANRITFTDPAAANQTIRATVWQDAGQVWLGYVEPMAPANSLRAQLDRMILQAVTPY